jgi:hypothetical protein
MSGTCAWLRAFPTSAMIWIHLLIVRKATSLTLLKEQNQQEAGQKDSNISCINFQIYQLTEFQDPTLSGTSITPNSEVSTAITIVFPVVGN